MQYNKWSDDDFTLLAQTALEKIRTDEDPLEITRLKKLFKKSVPLSMRNYVAAYMVKISLEQGGIRPGMRKTPAPWNKERTTSSREGRNRENVSRDTARGESESRKIGFEPPQRTPVKRIVIDESVATTIFIGTGRNRRVFPRDLIGLLTQAAEIDRERIGDIRVLDNYSFVQLYTEDAPKVIEILNGYMYRGRSLSVSFSRKREDEADTDFSGADSVVDDRIENDTESVAESAGEAN